MDGIHDLGGMSGFGPVEIERDEPVFHERWEALGYGLGALGINVLHAFNMDEVRHAIERIELPGASAAAGRNRRLERGGAGLHRHPGSDDRRRTTRCSRSARVGRCPTGGWSGDSRSTSCKCRWPPAAQPRGVR